MANWLTPALFSLLSFGIWGLLTKISINFIDSKSALVYQSFGVFIVGMVTLSSLAFKPAINVKGFGFALLTGIAYCVGCLFYLIAADRGKIETVVTLTALYPAVTMLLSFLIFKETLNFKQFTGIALALAAIYLMS